MLFTRRRLAGSPAVPLEPLNYLKHEFMHRPPFFLFLALCVCWAIIIGFAVHIAYDGDAVQPRNGLRADVPGCYELVPLGTLPPDYGDEVAAMRWIRLSAAHAVVGKPWRRVYRFRPDAKLTALVWVADSLTDTVRIGWSKALFGFAVNLGAPPRSARWEGSGTQWSDDGGTKPGFGRFAALRAPCPS